MDLVFGLIDPDRIMELPWIVKGPGIALIVLFLFRAIRCLFSLRLITLFTSLVYAVVIAIILSQAGEAIVQLLGVEESLDGAFVTPAFPSGFQYTA